MVNMQQLQRFGVIGLDFASSSPKALSEPRCCYSSPIPALNTQSQPVIATFLKSPRHRCSLSPALGGTCFARGAA
jgi:hypothetical protein